MSGILNSPFGGWQGDRVYSDAAAGLKTKTPATNHGVGSGGGGDKDGGLGTESSTRPVATVGARDQPPPWTAKRASRPSVTLVGKRPENTNTLSSSIGKRMKGGVVAEDGPQRRVRPGSVDLQGGDADEAKDNFFSRAIHPVTWSVSDESSREVRREIAEPVRPVEVYTSASRSPVERPAVDRDTVESAALPRPAVRNSPTAEARQSPAIDNGAVDKTTRPENWYYLSSSSTAHTASTDHRPRQSLASQSRRAGGGHRFTSGDDRRFKSGGSLEATPRVGARAVDNNAGAGRMTWGELVSRSGEYE